MIWTLQIVTVFMATTSDVSTLSLRRIKRENDLRNQIDHFLPKFSSEELSKSLKYIDSANISNTQIYQESTSPKNNNQMLYNVENINYTLQNGNEESRKAIQQVPITHNIDQNFTLNYEYNLPETSNVNKFSRVSLYKPIENYKNRSSEKIHNAQEEGSKLFTRSQAVRIQHSGLFKSIGTNFENYPIIPNQDIFGLKIKNYTTGGSNIHPWKRNENKGFAILHPKMKITESDVVRPDASAGVHILPHQNGDFNRRKIYQIFFLDFIPTKEESATLINPSRNYTYSNKELITTRGVFPEEQFSQDVLASAERETFHGFPKGKNQQIILKKNIENVSNTFNRSFETSLELNPQIPSEENNNTNIESQTATNGEVNALNGENSFVTEISTQSPKRIGDEIEEAKVSPTEEHRKSSTEPVTLQKEIESKHNELKSLANQKKEDDIQIQNAKYKFSTSQKDGISDLLHDRTETRQDGKVTGSYAYSDGFFLRKVNYVADKNGYRIISEDTMPLPGNGPKVNSEGTAHIRTDVGGHPLHYVVYGGELPRRTSPHQGKGKI